MKHVIDGVTTVQRKSLELSIICGDSFKGIAEEADGSSNTALGRMRYAITDIQKLIVTQNISLER